MTRRPGTMPLSTLRQYAIRPHQSPERVAERGDFYIRDGWLRASLNEGHGAGAEVCFLVDFLDSDDERSAQFVLPWSPIREKIVELIMRLCAPIGPCRLISRPLYPGLNIWCIVGTEDDGTTYDPLNAIPDVYQQTANPETL